MKDEAFEWDDDKAEDNYVKHGVSFDAARKVFEDPFSLERLDDRTNYGEERFFAIGRVGGQILFVAYTEREARIRLISARNATRHEQDDYFQRNA